MTGQVDLKDQFPYKNEEDHEELNSNSLGIFELIQAKEREEEAKVQQLGEEAKESLTEEIRGAKVIEPPRKSNQEEEKEPKKGLD